MFENLDDPQKQALLMMAAGLLAPQDRRLGKGGQFAAALSQGMQGGLMGYNNASREKRGAEALAEEARIRKMQADQMQRGAADEEYKRFIAPQFFQPGNAPADGMGPAMPPKADVQGFGMALAQRNPDMAAPYLPKPVKPNVQFAPNGVPVDLSDPQNLGKNFAPAPKPDKPKYVKGDTRTIKQGNFEVSQEYDGAEWKPIGKAPLWKPDAPEKGPTPPQGYQWGADGKSLTPIPGGPADAKVGKEADAMRKRERGALDRADFVLGQIGQAIKQTGVTTAGPVGAIARNIPGTSAYNLNRTLDSIKANIGFAELQAMREASPTGGALGQVAVQELNMLQAVLGSLDSAQSPQQLEQSLYKAEKHYQGWKAAVQKSKQQSSNGGFRVLGVEEQ